MKHYKPGQIVAVHGNNYRAKARTYGCSGCVFRHDLALCPSVHDKRSEPIIDCGYDNIILTTIPTN